MSGEACYDKRYLAYMVLAALLVLFFSGYFYITSKGLMRGSDNSGLGAFPGFPVDVNSADADSLMLLPGIGVKRAAAIISERESRGDFTNLEALREASGVSAERFEAIKKYIIIKKSGASSGAVH